MSTREREADRLVRYLSEHPGATLAHALLDASEAGTVQGALQSFLTLEAAGFIKTEPQTIVHLTALGRELASADVTGPHDA